MWKLVPVIGAVAVAVGLAVGAPAASAKACAGSGAPPTYANVKYATVGGVALTADIFEPAGSGKHPGLLVVHGGGWTTGCKEDVWPEARAAAADGFVAVAISYRLACTARSNPLCGFLAPAASDDAATAVAWLRAQAQTYRVDAYHVGSLGFSAGGQISYMLSTRGLIEAAAGLSGDANLPYTCQLNPDGNPCLARVAYIGCTFTACPAKWSANNPLELATKSSAPAFVANGKGDGLVKYQEAVDFTSRLKALKVPTQLCTTKGGAHAQAIEDLPCAEIKTTALDGAFAFLHTYLDG